MKDESEKIEDDEVLILMLCMSEKEANEAMGMIHIKYGENILGCLRKYGVFPDDREDLMQEVYCRIWKKAQSDTLQINRSLKPLLIKITHDVWVDFVRKRMSEQERISSDRYRLMCEESIHAKEVSVKTRKNAESQYHKFRDWLHTLPPRQQQIAYVWIDCHREAMEHGKAFAKRIGPRVVYDEMLKRELDPGSVGAVKGAMQQFREKFRTYIADQDEFLVEG